MAILEINSTAISEKKRISVVVNTVKQRQIISTEWFIFAVWVPVPFCLFEDTFCA